MIIVLRILALLFEFGALGLLVYSMIKEKKDKLDKDIQLIIRDGIIILLWASNTCLAILLMK